MQAETSDAPTEAATDARTSVGQPVSAPALGLRHGSAVGRYLVLERIGRGGMGAVYSAFDPQLDRRVALKVMLPSPWGQHELADEARALAKLNHRNVVGIHDVGEWEGRVFFAMELVDGVDLAHWLDERPRCRAELLEVFEQAARGLAAAHDAGLTHGDFKPGNVLIGSDGVARVADFGLAHATGPAAADSASPADAGRMLRDDANPTDLSPSDLDPSDAEPSRRGRDRTKPLAGTPRYMAPEQLEGLPATPASDQFALCVSLYSALAGTAPFPGSDAASLAFSMFERGDAPARPAGISRRVWAVLARGLSLRPEDRASDMHRVAEALLAARQNRTALWTELGVAALLTAVAAGVAYQRGAEDGGRTCDDGGARVGAVWNDARRQAVHDRIAESDADYGPRVADTTLAGLDRFADAWVDEYRAACQATMNAPERANLMVAACVERRLEGFDSLLVWLEEMDGAMASNAAQAAGLLDAPRTCRELRVTDSADRLPDDPELRLEIEQLQRDLRQTQFMSLIADPRQVTTVLDNTRTRVAATRYRPLMATWALYQSRADVLADRRDTAYDGLRRALNLAVGAGDDTLILRVAVDLLDFESTRGRFEEAERWMALGDSVADKVDPAGSTMFSFRNTKAILHARQGRPEVAVALWESMAQSRPEALAVQLNLVRAHLNASATDEAQQWANRHERTCRESLGAKHPECLRSAIAVGTVAAAAANHTRAVEMIEAALQPVLSGRRAPLLADVNAMHVLAVSRSYTGDRAGALALAKQTVELIRRVEPGWPDLGPKEESLATLLMLSGQYEAAREQYGQAAEDSKLQHQIHRARIGAAECSLHLGELDTAMATISALPPEGDAGVHAYALGVRGQIELALGDTDAAESSFRRMLELPSRADAGAIIAYATHLDKQGRTDDARKLLRTITDNAADYANASERVRTATELLATWSR